MELLALNRSIPTRQSTGHQNLANIALADAFLNLVVTEKLVTPDHIAALEDVMREAAQRRRFRVALLGGS